MVWSSTSLHEHYFQVLQLVTKHSKICHGLSGGMMVLGSFQCRGILLIRIIVGQGPTVLAVGGGGSHLGIFSLVYHFSFSHPLGDG